MLHHDEIQLLRTKSFELHFLHARLERPRDARVFEGPASIRQSGHELILTMYSPGAAPPMGFDEWIPGKLIPDEDYSVLTGLDMHGRTWTSNYILPHNSWSGPAKGSLVTAHIRQLEHADTRLTAGPTTSALQLQLFAELKIPPNARTIVRTDQGSVSSASVTLNVTEFDAATFRVRCVNDDGHVGISVAGANDRLPPSLGLRIREALQFVTATAIVPAVETEYFGDEVTTRVTVVESAPSRQRQLRFLERVDPDAIDAFTSLFDRYLRFVLTWPKAEPHPISVEWNAIIAISQASLESQALVLSVAVESLLKHVDPSALVHREDNETEAIDRCLDSLRTLAADASCPETLRNRLNGFISNYRTLRSVDKLYVLAASGRIDPALIDAWKALRHPAAHGATLGVSVDGTLQLRDAVLSLLYQITFSLIGYEGKFTNFAVEGWPEQSYPFPEI